MRISDWSSDVCSSDLWRSNDGDMELTGQYLRSQYNNSWREHAIYSSAFSIYGQPSDYMVTDPTLVNPLTGTTPFQFDDDGNFLSGWWSAPRPYVGEGDANLGRSEEHTSELQSLMRISYAVFCFKKKTREQTTKNKK